MSDCFLVSSQVFLVCCLLGKDKERNNKDAHQRLCAKAIELINSRGFEPSRMIVDKITMEQWELNNVLPDIKSLSGQGLWAHIHTDVRDNLGSRLTLIMIFLGTNIVTCPKLSTWDSMQLVSHVASI